MASETTRGGDAAAPSAAVIWREVRRQAVRLVATLVAVFVLALALSTAASGLQAGRDDARNADVVIVVAPPVPPQALVDRSFDLYRRNSAGQLVVVGAGSEGLQTALRERGVAEGAMSTVPGDDDETAQLRAALAAAREAGAASVVIAGEGAAMLRWMKVAQDLGLRPYAAPTPGPAPDLLELIQAGASYWRYALLGG